MNAYLRFSLKAVFLLALITSPASADCFCKGCGCKGGPGWRGPNDQCVSFKQLTKTCGQPPGAPCRYEGTTQVCESPRKQPSVTPAVDAEKK
jgi:hypothetical protein